MTQSLYLMKNELGLFKIGISKNPHKRRNEIKNSSGVNVELLKAWKTEEKAASVERMLHVKFADKRTHGEWFTDLTIEDIESNIDIQNDLVKSDIKIINVKSRVKPKPICELSLGDQLIKSMETIPSDQYELEKLCQHQKSILETLTKLLDKSKATQIVFKKDGSSNHVHGTGIRWYETLNSKVFSPTSHFLSIQKVPLDSIVFTRMLPGVASLPWLTTKEGARATLEIKRDVLINSQTYETNQMFNRGLHSLSIMD